MLEFLTLAGLSAGAKWLVKEVLGPLTKAAAEDFYKDFLRQCVSEGVTQSAPGALKRAVSTSTKEFLVLFQSELENCGLPGALTRHEFAASLKHLLNDSAVRQFLGRAFNTDVKELDGHFLAKKWTSVGADKLPEDFDWVQLTKNYVRRVKGLIRSDQELARQLELDWQARVMANTNEMVGISIDFDLRQYQESLKEKFGSLNLDSLDMTGAAYDSLRLWKVFVAQGVRECAEFAPQIYEMPRERLLKLQIAGEIDEVLSMDALAQQRRSYAEKPIESVLGVVGLNESPKVKRVVILGDPGSGKSTLLRALALDWAEQSQIDLQGKPVPILIELRLYAQDKSSGKCNSFLDYLHKGNAVCRLNRIEMDKLLKSGGAIALFDGVDEVFDPLLREAVLTDIHRFSNQYSKVQIVVTSRWLGYKAEALRKAKFQHYMLQNLDEKQIEEFVQRWHNMTFTNAQEQERERKRERLQRAISESKTIQELAGNPLLLTMMAILNRNQELPRDRVRLYERASEVLLYQWDVEEKLYEQEDLKNWRIDVRDKQAILRKVAHHMQGNENGLSGNVISRDDLERILTEYLKILEVDKARAVAKIMIEQLRERNFILCYLGADNYAFVHRTFLEFFCASEFVWQFEKERALDKNTLLSLYEEHFMDESWHEVLRLIAGMIEPVFVGDIIQCLMQQTVKRSDYLVQDDFVGYRLQRGGLSNILLAANCLSEIRTHSEISQRAKDLLDRLKLEIKNESTYRLDKSSAEHLIQGVISNWKDSSKALFWLHECLSSDDLSYVPDEALRYISRNWKNEPNNLAFLKDVAQEFHNSEVQWTANEVLAEFWKDDPDTLLILKRSVHNYNDEFVRSSAIEELVEGWKNDPDTLLILKRLILEEDENESVRSTAVQGLVEGWKNDPNTLLILKRLILEEDENEFVRSTAVQGLVEGWKNDPNTLLILKRLILEEDENKSVRSTAVQELVEGWKNDPDTLPILKRLILEKDENESVRSAAVQGLVKGWKNDPDTLPILKRLILEEDENESVRNTAVQELVEGWKNEPDTLPILKGFMQEEARNKSVRLQAVIGIVSLQRYEDAKPDLIKSLIRKNNDDYIRRFAADELIRFWRNDPDTFSLIKQLAQENKYGMAQVLAIEALTTIWKEEEDVLPLLKKLAQDYQTPNSLAVWNIALQQLVKGWRRDLDVFPMLHSMAQDAEYESVRSIAILELAKYWKNDEHTLSFLKSLAKEDENEYTRCGIILELARDCEKDSILPFLKSLAKEDDCEDVKVLVLSEIARRWKYDSMLFDFWCDRALQDSFIREYEIQQNPRQMALRVLIQRYPDCPETVELLHDRIRNDDDEKLRGWATQQLTYLEPIRTMAYPLSDG
ncbi:signal transduction protein with nacht domain protein [Leptolyngbya sp. Heron Island J]|uniref:HEAT repeat domain-containing protein n=1 Tax=Leptolyngbya sp. Heron Island J TaxID=1385935 RepID=UPI0003B9C846|nr:HEAT repeat domain-containing protein [Leptolyngbya sp. Heron Island J]ESA32474.1 signal transduction protein with nacht domain protein [Leptolyngbya sp. Heron Island J]